MNTRRSFFSCLAGMVAVVALAPELAFRAKLALPEVEGQMMVVGYDLGGGNGSRTVSQIWLFDIKRGDDGKEYHVISAKNFDENYAF